MQNNQIKDLQDPTDNQDAATKLYVDDLVGTNSLNNLTISGDGLLFDNLTGQLSLTANLDNIVDVDIQTIQNNQILQYNTTNQKWENTDQIVSIAAQEDVLLNALADDDILRYNSTSQKWENTVLVTTSTIQGASDYNNLIPPIQDDVITWNNILQKYEPKAFSSSSNLIDLDDVQVQLPLTDGQNLVYEQTLNKWINKSSVNQQIALLSYFANSTSAWIVSKSFVTNIGGFSVNFNTPSTLKNTVSN